jgi:hypothetical protein
MSFMKVLALKFRELLVSPVLLIMMVVLPVLSGLTAGSANLRNQSPRIRLAVTDLDGTEISRGLAESLKIQGWDILEVGKEDIPGLIDSKTVEGALVIERGFTGRLDSLIGGGLTYTPGEGTLTTNMVLDIVTYSVIPFKSRSVFLRQAKALYDKAGVPLPSDFDQIFLERTQASLHGGAKQEFIYQGVYAEPSVLTYVVNDYSMEVLFLGIFALLGMLALSSPAMRRRLCATSFGLRYDYAASLITLFAAGIVQIILYMTSMRTLMHASFSLHELYLLSVFLLMSLALSQALSLLHHSLRLYMGLIILLLLSVGGGCFIQLTQQLIRSIGQYLPQGWTLAALRGYPVPHAAIPIGISLLVLLFLYPLQAKRAGAPSSF